jgi:hypothetical protein
MVDDGGKAQRQLGGASVRHGAAFGQSCGAGHRDFVFLVVFVLPGLKRVGFQNLNHVENRPVFVLVVELVERGNLPAKRRSGITPEDEHHGLLPAERGELDSGVLIGSGQVEVRSGIAHVEASRPRYEPERLEGDKHHQRLRHMAHHLAEPDGPAHYDKQSTQKRHVDNCKSYDEFA